MDVAVVLYDGMEQISRLFPWLPHVGKARANMHTYDVCSYRVDINRADCCFIN